MNRAEQISTGEMILFLWSAHFSSIALDASYTAVESPEMIFWRAIGSTLLSILFGSLIVFSCTVSNQPIAFPKWCAFLLWVAVLAAFFQTISELLDFLQHAIFSSAVRNTLFWPILAAVFLAAACRVEGNLRFGAIIFWCCLIGTVLYYLQLTPTMEFWPVQGKSNASDILFGSFRQVFRNTEWFLFYLLLPLAKGKRRRAGIWCLISAGLLDLGFSGILYLSCGNFAIGLTYPWYQLTMVSESGIFQQTCDLYLLVWVLASFAKLTGFLLLLTSMEQTLFPKLRELGALLLLLPICLIGFFWKGLFPLASTIVESGIPQLFGWFVLPIVLFIKQRRTPHETNASTIHMPADAQQ